MTEKDVFLLELVERCASAEHVLTTYRLELPALQREMNDRDRDEYRAFQRQQHDDLRRQARELVGA